MAYADEEKIVGEVETPKEVKSIGARAFSLNINVVRVILPEELTRLGNSAFSTAAV